MEIEIPQLITIPFANNGDKNVIPDDNENLQSPLASFKQGFPQITGQPKTAGGLPPRREDFNGVFNVIFQHLKYLNGGGVYRFNQAYCDFVGGYWKGAKLQTNDGEKIYLSLVDNNTLDFNEVETEEELDGYWEELGTNAKSGSGMPIGAHMAFEGSVAPRGWLVENGEAVSRTEYSKLFEQIGTTYGVGDGETTFNLPNRLGKYMKYSNVVGVPVQAKAPNITGAFGGTATFPTSGAFEVTETSRKMSSGSTATRTSVSFDASRSSSVYSDTATTIDVDALTALPCIKAFDDIEVENPNDLAWSELVAMKGVPIGTVMRSGAKEADEGYIKLADEMTYIKCTAFPTLVTKCYVGDSDNATAPYFFKCDSTGTTRSTSGEYFALPSYKQIDSFLIESGTDSQTGISYRIYSDGWCQQRITIPRVAGSTNRTVTLFKTYKDTSYKVLQTMIHTSSPSVPNSINSKTINSFRIWQDYETDIVVEGYIDPSEMPSVQGIVQIKAWDKAIQTGDVAVQQLINDWQNNRVVSTIIYPNGGSASSPANVTTNQRIVMDNPYEGYFVDCKAQILVDNNWSETGWIWTANGVSYGSLATQYLPTDKIVLQTGTSGIGTTSNLTGNAFGLTDSWTNNPCRIIVTRLGKMPS